MSRVTDLFVDAGELAWEAGELPEAVALLSARLDLAGAGPLLQELVGVCWAPPAAGRCPVCGHKGTPDPHRPPPPPPPPPPTTGGT